MKYIKKCKGMFLWILVCLLPVISGCANMGLSQNYDKITIVCTNFPLYDWTRQVLGESDAEVILLLDNGADMHSFQPSAEEMIQIADCDMIVYVGGESDAWLADALETNPNEERIEVNLMEVLRDEVKAEVYTEGMQTEHIHSDGEVCTVEHDENEHDGVEIAADEHVWLSLRMAVKSCSAIEEALCNLMPEAETVIRANGEAYCGELAELDQSYHDMVTESSSDGVVIVADRFPFMYLMEELGIEYYAAFPGCSTESEADFETVVFMAEKVKEHDTDVLFITESGTDTLANAVFENAESTGEVAVLHSMQVVYRDDVASGCTYIEFMEENLTVLESVLK